MSQPLAFTNATLITGDRDGTILHDRTVVVGADGRIVTVGPAAETSVPDGARVVDARGRFVMPGLINAHAHLFSDGRPIPKILTSERAEKLVALFAHSPFGHRWLDGRTKRAVLTQMNTGVTTIRSLGEPGYEVVRTAAAIERGDYLGPRLIPSGPLLAIPEGHGAPQIALICSDADATRRNTRQNLDNGVRAMKISATGGVTDAKAIGHAGTPEMSETNMRIVCEEAHAAGILVAAHAQSEDGILAALRAGVDTIEHGAAMSDEVIALFKDNPNSLRGHSSLIPTLMACLPLVKLEPSVTGANEVSRANAVMVLDEMLAGIRVALEHDIELGMGTDSALTFVTHYNTWREIDFVIRYGGVPAARALHAATGANARILGIDGETGSIDPGKSADLLVTAANPLDDVRTLASPVAVVVRGELIDAPSVTTFPEIDALLDEF
ncbi:amidohydrolase family protein [Tsukamurella sp. NPDC003166]|uniref:amidohydrolase family protein n=1 Tax=Tsukamurella sp. NPDC003166 TaxID=3154444 RepID=UPI0033A632BF